MPPMPVKAIIFGEEPGGSCASPAKIFDTKSDRPTNRLEGLLSSLPSYHFRIDGKGNRKAVALG